MGIWEDATSDDRPSRKCRACRKYRRVMVIAGDGDALMGVGSFAIIAVVNPRKLSILVVGNGLYQETAGQATYTARGTDIEKMAQGAGIKSTMTVAAESEIESGTQILLNDQDASLVVLRASPTIPPRHPRENDAAVVRARFRTALGLNT